MGRGLDYVGEVERGLDDVGEVGRGVRWCRGGGEEVR